jgi:hypothetical protein
MPQQISSVGTVDACCDVHNLWNVEYRPVLCSMAIPVEAWGGGGGGGGGGAYRSRGMRAAAALPRSHCPPTARYFMTRSA